ncbi:uncharacterized protein LOC108673042 [Hyalella azteca]|uniref:Uncharacterized protein LOC108673042 n=1 Tax=Hyalella azteca TaxID=294128 RepID=A0A8B7NRI9_HYAAZ|nr:uncharacterized protein LOC108673042 [Hyalella azteca]
MPPTAAMQVSKDPSLGPSSSPPNSVGSSVLADDKMAMVDVNSFSANDSQSAASLAANISASATTTTTRASPSLDAVAGHSSSKGNHTPSSSTHGTSTETFVKDSSVLESNSSTRRSYEEMCSSLKQIWNVTNACSACSSHLQTVASSSAPHATLATFGTSRSSASEVGYNDARSFQYSSQASLEACNNNAGTIINHLIKVSEPENLGEKHVANKLSCDVQSTEAPQERLSSSAKEEGVCDGKNDYDVNDIIDVVSVREATCTKTTETIPGQHPTLKIDEPNSRPFSQPLQMSMTVRNEAIKQQMLQGCLVSSRIFTKELTPHNRVSQSTQEAPCPSASSNETLDLCTRPKASPSNSNSPHLPSTGPIDIQPSSPDNQHDQNALSASAPGNSNDQPRDQAPHSGTFSIKSSLSGDFFSVASLARSSSCNSVVEEDRVGSFPCAPTSNLPPHILAWLLGSQLNPLHRMQHSLNTMAIPNSSLLGLSSLYSPSPAVSPDEPLDIKPLDLSSKASGSPDSPMVWPLDAARPSHPPTAKPSVLGAVGCLTYDGDADSGGRAVLRSLGASGPAATPPLPEPLSTEDLITRVLEAKASGRGRRRTDQSKRSYTDTELQAALRDIQSGKLGTRRAAVIYGIPRSTLRNKVYKLAIEKERAKKVLEQNAAEAMTLLPMPEEAAFTSSETLRALIRNKMAIKLEEITKISPSDLHCRDEEVMDRRQAQDPALAHLIENITSLALSTERSEILDNLMSSLSLYPKLEDFAKRMIEKRYAEEINRSKLAVSDSLRGMTHLTGTTSISPDPSLVIPSYDPAGNSYSSTFDHSAKPLSEPSQGFARPIDPADFKVMITHYMNQKNGAAECTGRPVVRDDLSSGEKLPEMRSPTAIHASAAPAKEKRGKKRAGSPVSSCSSGGKGSRPKRGKYRNYDRENLIKAVQAVQSGEMSVHRAGSFYGVPHSTLEYKVKERHLNRNKKKDGAPTTPTATNPNTVKSIPALSGRPTMVPPHSFSLENTMFGREFSHAQEEAAATIDLTEDDGANVLTNDLNDTYNLTKMKFDVLDMDDNSDSPNSTQVNPFNLWNSPSPLIPSFLPNPYERESFYASQMIRRFQEAASSSFQDNFQEQNSSRSPVVHRSEQESPMQGQSSGSCSPNLEKARPGTDSDTSVTNSSVLDALLRGKSPIEAAAAVSANPGSPQPSSDIVSNPWSVSSQLLNLSKRLTEVQEENLDLVTQQSPSISAINALRSLGLQSSLAAALRRQGPSDVQSREAHDMEAASSSRSQSISEAVASVPENVAPSFDVQGNNICMDDDLASSNNNYLREIDDNEGKVTNSPNETDSSD